MSTNKKISNSKKGIFIVAAIFTVVIIGLGGFFIFSKDKLMPSRVYKIGILNGYDFFSATADGFKAQMTKFGYIEGKNVIYDIEKRNPVPEEYQAALKKFADEKVDLILTFPTEASVEGKKTAVATGIPVVFSNANIEDMGIVDSIKKPGNNLTGVRYPGPDIALKRLEVMLEIFPNIKNLVVPYDKNYPTVPSQIRMLKKWAPVFGVNLTEAPVSSPAELQDFFSSTLKSGKKIDAILTIAEVVSATPDYVDIYGKFADENKIPFGGAFTLKKNGYNYESFFGVSTDSFAVGQKAAVLANDILKGGSAGDIPVVSADKYLEINYKKASEMGINISESLLNTADNVVY